MTSQGPILIIDDDPDDRELIQRVFAKLGITLQQVFLSDAEEALHYLNRNSVKPALVICDINMPLMTGLELKEQIEATDHLKSKRIPFVFLTTSANDLQLKRAFELGSNGFFVKGKSYEELKEVVKLIVDYWMKSHRG